MQRRRRWKRFKRDEDVAGFRISVLYVHVRIGSTCWQRRCVGEPIISVCDEDVHLRSYNLIAV